MPRLIGFEPSIKMELRFTGLEILYLLFAAKHHYDGCCKNLAQKAGDYEGARNGLLILLMWQINQDGRYNHDAHRDSFQGTDEEFLYQNRESTATHSLTWHEIDTLCKVTECFSLIMGTPGMEPIAGAGFDPDVAANLAVSLRGALQAASIQQEILNEQEALRREQFSEADKLPNTLSHNAN